MFFGSSANHNLLGLPPAPGTISLFSKGGEGLAPKAGKSRGVLGIYTDNAVLPYTKKPFSWKRITWLKELCKR